MVSILITGCSRGIGLGLVKNILAHNNPPKILIATCRNPDGAAELKALASQHSNLVILKLDVDKVETFADVARQVEAIVGEDGLNVLINNAGIGSSATRLEDADPDTFLKILQTNTVSPMFLIKALLPLIKKAAVKNEHKALGYSRAAILNMSSNLGSVSMTDRPNSCFYGYSSSKAGLNQATRGLALELAGQGIVVVVLHPGWVRTDMGGPNAFISVEESASGLTKVIYELSAESHNRFVQWDGTELPW